MCQLEDQGQLGDKGRDIWENLIIAYDIVSTYLLSTIAIVWNPFGWMWIKL